MKVELLSMHMEFGELDAGDVFLMEDDMYLKLESGDLDVNAVDLEDGTMSTVKDDTEVVHFPGATVHVEEPDEDDD